MRRRKRNKKHLIFLVFFFILFLIFIIFRKFEEVKEIHCVSDGSLCDLLIEELKPFLGKSFHGFEKVLKEYTKDNYLISEYSYEYVFPNKLLVRIVERKAEFILENDNQQNRVFVSLDGFVFEKGEADLPKIITDKKIPKAGEKIDEETIFALHLIRPLSKDYRIKKSELRNDSLTILFENGIKAIFPLSGDKEFLLGSFVLIYQELYKDKNSSKIDIGSFDTIDLRYKNPILRQS